MMVSSTNKWKLDFQKGVDNVATVCTNINAYFETEGSEFCIYRTHRYLKKMELNEKSQNNTISNRHVEAAFIKAMGLDCMIASTLINKNIPLFIRYSDDFGFYLKLPSTVKTPTEIKEYLKLIWHYQVLFVHREKGVVHNLYCGPTPLKNIIQHCGYALSDAKGNKNRLQFDYNPGKLIYLAPENSTFFAGSLYDKIKELIT